MQFQNHLCVNWHSADQQAHKQPWQLHQPPPQESASIKADPKAALSGWEQVSCSLAAAILTNTSLNISRMMTWLTGDTKIVQNKI